MQKVISLYLVGLMLFISACSQNRTLLVSNKNRFDENSVYTYPNLSLPPLYYLTSSEIADQRRFLKESHQSIRDLLFGNKVISTNNNNQVNNLTAGDKEFLILAKANGDLSDIRDKIDNESLNIQKKNNSFLKKVFANYQGETLDDKFAEYQKYNK